MLKNETTGRTSESHVQDTYYADNKAGSFRMTRTSVGKSADSSRKSMHSEHSRYPNELGDGGGDRYVV